MTTQQAPFHAEAKDELLRRLLKQIVHRGIAQEWGVLNQPYSALLEECKSLRQDSAFLSMFRMYLEENTIIVQTVETLLAQLAMAANARWQDTPDIVQGLSRRGWHISRWLPTFLIVDGPLGRVLSANNSPLSTLLKKEHASYPVLCAARDAFNHELFRLVRNGIGHWAFLWKESNGAPRLETVDWKTGRITATISLFEAEALHLLAFSVIEALDNEVFKFIRLRSGA